MAVGAAIAVATAAAAIAPIDPYVESIVPEYDVKPILSVGDTVPRTGDPTSEYRMVGIPDGLGAHRNGDDTVTVYMNHELTGTTQTEPRVGGPLNRGAFVSKVILGEDGSVISADRAYDTVYQENLLVGPAAEVGNATRAFSRFCSGALAGREHGFDRPIYFANEEDGTPANTFDGLGGQAVAIFDNEAHALPRLGRFAWENTLVQPTRGNATVIIGMEDGPASLDPAAENSQLYLYVGKKERRRGASVLRRNGLDNGELYVLAPVDPAMGSELPFQTGSSSVKWIQIPYAYNMSEEQLEAASDAVGAFMFARPEDGAFNTRNRHEYFFVTTGGAAGANSLGRLYSLRLHSGNPVKPATLSVVYNADQVIAAGGDIAISPDNIDVSDDYLMINEDGTTESRAVMASKGRDGSIWRFDLQNGPVGVDAASAYRVAELAPPGRDGIAVGPGVWETSGIIDVGGLFDVGDARNGRGRGDELWLFDVQAHGPTGAPVPNTQEDGQLLFLLPAAS
jgi:hypothetical protein